MTEYQYRVVSEGDAAAAVLRNKPNFLPWIGAGVSIEARIPGAQQICELLADKYISQIQLERQLNKLANASISTEERQSLLSKELHWHDVSTRYARTIKRVYAGRPDRVDFFRRLVSGRSPAFAHYATALLVQNGVFSSDCLTTNFDKLLEKAFHDVGLMECQPIRSAEELEFHQSNSDKAYCLKIHGDYDTHNLLNTEEETVVIEKPMGNYLTQILRNRGLLVIGSAGYEKSVHTLFDILTTRESIEGRILHYGLLWGVYIGGGTADPVGEVRRRVEAGEISRDIVRVMDRNFRRDTQFAFFPVIGAGEFFRRLMIYAGDESLLRMAEPFYDHEMRIKSLFERNGLSEHAYFEHVKRLQQAQKRLDSAGAPVQPVWAVQNREVPGTPTRISLWYGSLADSRLLTAGRQNAKRAAVVSPDDTFISVGGGTALALARAAGERSILHDVSKLAPISLGQVAATSAGKLPVEFIFHGASVELSNDGVLWSEDSIYQTTQNALLAAVSLGVQVLFVPLLAAGAGRAPPSRSVHQILRAVFDLDRLLGASALSINPLIINIVVFQEAELPRHEFIAEYEALC